MKKILVVLVFLAGTLPYVSGQEKYEKEYRLDKDLVPAPALQFVEALPFTGKVKWYKEEGLNSSSVEAKTKYQSKRYSIEFDTTGVIEDIEVKIKWKEVPENTQVLICRFLCDNFQKNKIRKIQRQFTGSSQALQSVPTVPPSTSNASITIRYELVVQVKKEGEYEELELLFEEKGGLIMQSKIVSQNTDNLEY